MIPRQPINVLIVDHREIILTGIRVLLERFSGLHIVGDARNLSAAGAFCIRQKPDVVIANLRVMDGKEGETIAALRKMCSQAALIALVDEYPREQIQGLLSQGVIGCVTLNTNAGELLSVIESSRQGRLAISPEVTRILLKPSRIEDVLTEREREILGWITTGLTNSEIASKLGVSRFTVKNHVSSLLAKLGVSSRTEAATLAIRSQLVQWD